MTLIDKKPRLKAGVFVDKVAKTKLISIPVL